MTKLTGRVLHKGDPGWDGARHGFNARYDYDDFEPEVVVFCQDAQDVSNAVLWALENDKPLRPRCGRHNYQAYSSLVKGGIVIDVNDMESIRIDQEQRLAQIGAGLNMIQISELLSDSGVTIPLATGPSVGIAGLTLGGGFGINSRKFGLTCDNLVNVELVSAEGKIVNANAKTKPDLFWACQGGGGGNFGIATSFTFKVHPTSLVAAFNVSWSWDQFDNVVNLWQEWAPSVDYGITSLLSLTVNRTITLLGQFTAEEEELPRVYELLQPLLSRSLPISVSIQIAPHVNVARMLFGVDPVNPQWAVHEHNDNQIFKSTSALAYDLFSPSAIKTLRELLEMVPPLSAPPSQPSMIQLLGGGGAGSRVASDATAVVHRQAKFVVQYDGYWTAPQDAQPTLDWVHNMRVTMSSHTRGAYVNYADENIENYLDEYYGSNLKRLVEVKQSYDPQNVFNYPQSIPVCL